MIVALALATNPMAQDAGPAARSDRRTSELRTIDGFQGVRWGSPAKNLADTYGTGRFHKGMFLVPHIKVAGLEANVAFHLDRDLVIGVSVLFDDNQPGFTSPSVCDAIQEQLAKKYGPDLTTQSLLGGRQWLWSGEKTDVILICDRFAKVRTTLGYQSVEHAKRKPSVNPDGL